MEPLATNQNLLAWYSVCPTDSRFKTRIYGAFTVIMATSLASVVLTSGLYCMEFISVDLESSLYAIYQLNTSQSVVYIIISSYLVRDKFNKIFSDLREIYKICERNSNLNFDNFINQNVKIPQKLI